MENVVGNLNSSEILNESLVNSSNKWRKIKTLKVKIIQSFLIK